MLRQKYLLIFLTLFTTLFSITISEIYFIHDFTNLFFTLSFTFVIFIFIFYFIFSNLTQNLENEITKIIEFLKNLTKQENNLYINSNFSKEFKNITKLLRITAKTLSKQSNKQKAYTDKLEISNTQKDEIISAISHEFKNPIAVINGYSQTLLKDDNLPKSLRKKFLTKIHKNGVKLTTLIDTLRLAIKLDDNKQKLYFKEVDIYNLTKDIVEDIKDSYDREIKIFGEKNTIKADKVLLGIAIRNLIENGIKYSEDEILIMITNNYISIIDKGIGINKNEIDKITEKFYRVSNNTWNNSLGLGLSIVNNIVKTHNFRLEIKSEENKGSEFKILFS